MNPMLGVFRGFDIAASSLTAEMQRSEIVAANLANINMVGNDKTPPYRRRGVIFKEILRGRNELGTFRGIKGAEKLSGGVRISSVYVDDRTPFKKISQPGSPYADKDGMVLAPNVDMFKEMVDLTVIERSFQANLTAMRTYRTMLQNTINNFR